MRTSALQYLYLQKPISSIILICILSILPWILNNNYTFDEAGQTDIAKAILSSGEWIIPQTNLVVNTIQPPMVHWLIAICSLPQGFVTPLTSHIPSAFAYITLMVFVLLFFGRYLRFQEAFITTLILVTSFEVHWAGITLGANIIYSVFVVIALFKMFRWESKRELKGLPVIIPLMLSGAILTKGLAGVLYPLIIFGSYLFFFNKYSLFRIIKSVFYLSLTSLFIPAIWYVEGWRQGGEHFLHYALIEDIHSLYCLESLHTFLVVILGFLPWTVLLLCSLFGLNKKDFEKHNLIEKDEEEKNTRRKVKLFSFISAVGFAFLTMISQYNNSSDYLPAYPFIAIFIAHFIIYLTENKAFVIRIFAGILSVIVCLLILLLLIQITHTIDIITFLTSYFPNIYSNSIHLLINSISTNNLEFIILFLLLLISLLITGYQMLHKINIKILYATIFLIFSCYLFLDGVILCHIIA